MCYIQNHVSFGAIDKIFNFDRSQMCAKFIGITSSCERSFRINYHLEFTAIPKEIYPMDWILNCISFFIKILCHKYNISNF